jgi:UDPglucose 6-dehydrogenase
MNLAVIGLGKLGLPLAALLATSGNKVKGYDLSASQREVIVTGKFTFAEPGLNELLIESANTFEVCDSISKAVKDAEVVFVIVPTPSTENGSFSNRHVVSAVKEIGFAISDSTSPIVIDIVSTVMPNSCQNEIRDALEKSASREIGSSLGLCYNPEFIALGSVIHDMEYPDMHLIGQSAEWAGELVEKALKTIAKREVPTRRMNLTEAELVKIAVNNFVTMKIAYANMLFQVATILKNVDVDVVTNAIGLDTRIGSKYLRAAAPYGGPCFPRDTRALSSLFREMGLSDSLSYSTDLANKNHVEFISKIIQEKTEIGAKIGVAGISYKTGTNVIDESPGIAIAKLLLERGYEVIYWDDEGASCEFENVSLGRRNSVDEFCLESEFVVITRPLNEPIAFMECLKLHNREYLDLWRQL